MTNFIRDNFICRFGIPKLLSDSSTRFFNMHSWRLLDDYVVDHMKLSPYYPQGNGHAEATNKTLVCVLNRIVYEEKVVDFLSPTLSVYRPFYVLQPKSHLSLVYSEEAKVPTEVMARPARLALANTI